jgi:hypothetical protein
MRVYGGQETHVVQCLIDSGLQAFVGYFPKVIDGREDTGSITSLIRPVVLGSPAVNLLPGYRLDNRDIEFRMRLATDQLAGIEPLHVDIETVGALMSFGQQATGTQAFGEGFSDYVFYRDGRRQFL